MHRSRWPVVASTSLAAGGLAWLVKIGLIVGTNGRVMTTGPAAALMAAGLFLLVVGSAAAGVWAARGRHVALRALAALGGVAVLALSLGALGWVGAAVMRDRGPAYAAEEAGLLAAALLWLTVGMLGRRMASRSVDVMPVVA